MLAKRLAFCLTLLFITITAFSQSARHPGFVRSHFREIQTRCISNKIESHYDLKGFEIHASGKEEVFVIPADKRYKWKIWRSTENKNYFVIISLIRDKKGRVKNTKKACVSIDTSSGVIYDEMVFKKYTLFADDENLKKLKKKKKDDAAKYNSDVVGK